MIRVRNSRTGQIRLVAIGRGGIVSLGPDEDVVPYELEVPVAVLNETPVAEEPLVDPPVERPRDFWLLDEEFEQAEQATRELASATLAADKAVIARMEAALAFEREGAARERAQGLRPAYPGGRTVNLGRIGHYHTPNMVGDGACQTAIVVHVAAGEPVVNLAVWQHDGEVERHIGVLVSASDSGQNAAPTLEGRPSFHLALDCPFRR